MDATISTGSVHYKAVKDILKANAVKAPHDMHIHNANAMKTVDDADSNSAKATCVAYNDGTRPLVGI